MDARHIAHLALCDPNLFSRAFLSMRLRRYQAEVVTAIVKSVRERSGYAFVVEMSRQAGKNEVSAHLEAYLLTLYRNLGGEMVKASPTFKPQTERSMLRLENRLRSSPWLEGLWRKKMGYIYGMGNASIAFLSGEPGASVVGGTASLLLELDEAQDIGKQKYDKDFAPMRASTNATAVFYGTAWTNRTLLYDQAQAALQSQQRDGARRVFKIDWARVAEENADYGKFVQDQIDRLGENHPIVKTQYKLLEIDAEGKLFSPQRQALMRGTHDRQHGPAGDLNFYVVTIDVSGEDEAAISEKSNADRDELHNKKRDATTLTVFEVITPQSAIGFEHNALRQNLYLVRDRKMWLGQKHSSLFGQLSALIDHWRARYVVVDATGIGQGLTSFLSKAFPNRVIPFEFSAATKSDLGWAFVALIETGRYRDYADDQAQETRQMWYEVEACEYKTSEGPGQMIRWGVWESPAYDGVIARGHDDFLIGAALVSVVDDQPMPQPVKPIIISGRDPLKDIDRSKF